MKLGYFRARAALRRLLERLLGGAIVTPAMRAQVVTERFRESHGYEPNLIRPQTYNEKVSWYKLHYRDPLMAKCADKLGMRDYVEATLGEGHTVPLLGVWRRPDDIDFAALPDSFVLKLNSGSGCNLVIHSRQGLDEDAVRDVARQWLEPSAHYYRRTFEWVYKRIRPRVFAEVCLSEADQELPDYKFYCFHGQPQIGSIVGNRHRGITADYFDIDGTPLDLVRGFPNSSPRRTIPPEWPEMVRIAGLLAAPFSHVRVDLYAVNGVILVGELTFYPGDGLKRIAPMEHDYRWGELWALPKASRSARLFDLIRP